MKKIIMLLIIALILTGCGYDAYEIPDGVYFDLNKNSFLVFEKHNSSELVNDTNVEIISKNVELIHNNIGEYVYTLEYKYNKRKYKYDINYKVIDDDVPIFISASSTITVKVNEETNLCNKIVYADNYDNVPTCSVFGNYDISNVGTYKDLEFVIMDSSKNDNRKKFTLNVVDEIKNVPTTSTPKYIYIDEILKNYKNNNTSIGIDVSRWQGNIDFDKVKKAGIEFVIMRIGVQTDPSEEIEIDSRFKEYYKHAKEAGLKVSVYVYNTATSRKDGIMVAKWVIDMLNGDKLDYPIAYDWENWKDFNNYKISLHTLSEGYLGFEETLRKAGYDSMLYSSKYYLENVWMNYDNSNIWLAHYTNKTDYKGKYMLWQMTSLAKIDGITDNTVDIDILYK